MDTAHNGTDVDAVPAVLVNGFGTGMDINADHTDTRVNIDDPDIGPTQ